MEGVRDGKDSEFQYVSAVSKPASFDALQSVVQTGEESNCIVYNHKWFCFINLS